MTTGVRLVGLRSRSGSISPFRARPGAATGGHRGHATQRCLGYRSPMAENDLLKRFLDAGVAFTQMTQKRAEEIVNELVRSGEMRAEQAQAMVQELVERSRQNTERFVEQVSRTTSRARSAPSASPPRRSSRR